MSGVAGVLSDSFLELLGCTLAGPKQFPFYICNILAPSNFRKIKRVEQYFICTYSSLLVQEDNFLFRYVFLCVMQLGDEFSIWSTISPISFGP